MATDRPMTFMPQLDGIRALAVASVAIVHWFHPGFFGVIPPLGLVGVQLFFVLSGFLITGILLDVRRKVGDDASARRFALRSFWMRRFYRLVPAAVLYIAVAAATGFLVDVRGLHWYLSYLGNFRIVQLQEWSQGSGHLWSLAVEEQFYLAIPLIILWQRKVPLAAVFTVGFAIAAVANYRLSGFAVFVPPAAFDGLFVGCGLALVFYGPRRIDLSRPARLGLPIMIFATIALGSEGFTFTGSYSLYRALFHLGAAGFVWRAAIGKAGRVYELGPIAWLGKVSYGFYLWHQFAMWILPDAWSGLPNPVKLVLAGTTTCAITWVSFTLVERPLIARKVNHPYVRPGAVAAPDRSGVVVLDDRDADPGDVTDLRSTPNRRVPPG